jgi:hypothetical protein
VHKITDKPRLPDYEVVIHIQYNSFGKKLEEQILSDTESYELDESTEYGGRKDFHWVFKTWEEALAAGDVLRKYCNNPNLLFLKIKANNKINQEPVVYKG